MMGALLAIAAVACLFNIGSAIESRRTAKGNFLDEWASDAFWLAILWGLLGLNLAVDAIKEFAA